MTTATEILNPLFLINQAPPVPAAAASAATTVTETIYHEGKDENMTLIDKTLIIIATRYDHNVYDGCKYFHDDKIAYDVEICSENVGPTEINYKKWQDAYIRKPNYKYYMLLHDDSREFAPNWLYHMMQVLNEKSDPPIGAVCHQLYSSNGQPATLRNGTVCNDDFQIYGGNKETELLVQTVLQHFFGDKYCLTDLAGGEQVLIHNHVLAEMQKHGGIPIPAKLGTISPHCWHILQSHENGRHAGPIGERIFSGFINSMGYSIKDCRVPLPSAHPFKHNGIGGTIIECDCTNCKKII